MKTQDIYNNLIQSLKLVVSPFDIQIASLPEFADITDEIVLIYSDVYIMIPQINELLSPRATKMLDDLDELFEKMSEDKSLWNIDSLKESDLWIKSRELGRLILQELKEKYDNPNLDFINWIK